MRSEFVQKWASQVKKGTLSFIVMKLLSGNELYGYELIEQIKRHTEIEIAEGTLYPLLTRLRKQELVEAKWVEQETGIPRKYHTLTSKGETTLQEMIEYWDSLSKAIDKIK